MLTVPHRQMPNRARECAERAWNVVDRQMVGKVICRRCGATYKTIEAVCSNLSPEQACPGETAIKTAFDEALAKEKAA